MSLVPYDNLERAELARLVTGELRIVHAQRKRKLRKRGERVWWNNGICEWVWTPPWFHVPPNTRNQRPA